jgi:hypothetical protein
MEDMTMTIMGPIQRAARITLGSADLEVRERCRSAPAWIRRRIDASRQQRGLPPLWGAEVTRRRVAAKVERLRVFLSAMRGEAAQGTS